MPYEKVVTFSCFSGEQNEFPHIESTLPSSAHDAVPVKLYILHFKTNISPMTWLPVCVMLTAPIKKTRVASIQVRY